MKNRDVPAVLAFIDLIDSTRNASYLSQAEYVDHLLIPYQRIASDLATKLFTDKIDYTVRGDEVFISATSDRCKPDEAIRKIIEYCLILKASIFCTDFNKERINSQRVPFDIGAGIHFGPVIKLPSEGERLHIEGYSINQAKRIEASSRVGKECHIVLSESARRAVFEEFPAETILILGPEITVEAKGISGELSIFEVNEYYSPSLFLDIENNVKGFSETWQNICDKLMWISSSYSWASLLMVGWKFWRAEKIADDGLLKLLVEFISKREFLKSKFISLFFLASSEYLQDKYADAFFHFEKAQRISNQRRVLIPKLLSAISLVKTGFIQQGDLLSKLKYELSKVLEERNPPREQMEKLTELKGLLKI